MPELPEVETIKNQITEVLPMRIDKVYFSKVSSSIIKTRDFSPLNLVIEKVVRQGKVLRFFLSGDKRIISGLGMSGGWRISREPMNVKHTHIQFSSLVKGQETYLAYVDPRRFGVAHFFNEENEAQWLTRLGVDVSTDQFTLEYLLTLKNKFPEKKIKPFLLEQNYFAGVGNYMASEICARALIRPSRRMKTLRRLDLENILVANKIVLDDAITTGGTTFSGGYADAFGEKGAGVTGLVVFYQEICRLCEVTAVKKVVMLQRGTYYCPRCQV